MKNESMYPQSHIWHGDPTMDTSKPTKPNGSDNPTEIWPNSQGLPTKTHNQDATKLDSDQKARINRIEQTLRKIAQMLQGI